jgi:hypothetical protein
MRAIQRVVLVRAPEPIAQVVQHRPSLQAAHITEAATTLLRMAVHIPVR